MIQPNPVTLPTATYYDAYHRGAYVWNFSTGAAVLFASASAVDCGLALTAIGSASQGSTQYTRPDPTGLEQSEWTPKTWRQAGGSRDFDADRVEYEYDPITWNGTEAVAVDSSASISTTTQSVFVDYYPNGVWTNLTSVVLRDPTNTFGLRRTDTGEIIKAAGTVIPHRQDNGVDIVGRYILPVTLETGVQYEWWDERTKSNGTVDREQHFLTLTATDGWYYAKQQAVEDLIGDLNEGIVFDLDNDGNMDADAVLRAGKWSDGYIDLKLRNASLTAPNPLTDAAITAVLKSASAHLAAWYGFHQRGLRDSQSGQPATAIAGIMDGYKAFADAEIDRVIAVLTSEMAGDGGITAHLSAPSTGTGCLPHPRCPSFSCIPICP